MTTLNTQPAVFKCQTLGALAAIQLPWTLTVLDTTFTVDIPYLSSQSLSLLGIQDVHLKKGLIWDSLRIRLVNNELELPGIAAGGGERIKQYLCSHVMQELKRYILVHRQALAELENNYNSLLKADYYVRKSLLNSVMPDITNGVGSNRQLLAYIHHPLMVVEQLPDEIRSQLKWLRTEFSPEKITAEVKKQNDLFVAKELKKYQDFFDTVEKSPLTEEQRIASIIFEDNNLLVAAAGSGKSSTLVGKAAYAVHKGLFKPDEILTLTFNKAATRELSERITRYARLPSSHTSITSKTFHALGYKLINQHRGGKGNRLRPVSNHGKKQLLREALETCLLETTFLTQWVNFLSYFRQPEEDYHSFKNVKDYEDHIAYQKSRAREGKSVNYKALNGRDVLKSAEELEIANWCVINGVPFEYEKPFPFLPDGWKKYEPDFYFPDIDTWHEHFALNADGSSPFKFNYETQAAEKRQWLEQQAPGRWFETQSHEFYSGTLIEKLKAALIARGQRLRPMDAQTILKHLRNIDRQDETSLILTVISLIKNRNINTHELKARLLRAKNKPRAQAFINVFSTIFTEYQKLLKAKGMLDFDDMISMSAQLLEEKVISSPYKLILVDEFQDISTSRTRLLKALLAQHPHSVLFGVGDDWQAINGFAGSDLDFFMHFEKVFGHTSEQLLTETFRCAQAIADVSATFIQKNTGGQKLKAVHSRSRVAGTIDLISYNKQYPMHDRLEETLIELFAEARNQQTSAKVQILGRYGISKTNGLLQRNIDAWNRRFKGYLSIEYMTAHGSKGLEADHVLIVGMTGGRGMTFPSSFTTDPIIESLSNKHDNYPHAEERRLFYVAMTRAKKKVFIFFHTAYPSPFIGQIAKKEYAHLITLENKPFQYCSSCGDGAIIEATGAHGAYSRCLACDKTKSNPDREAKGINTRKRAYKRPRTFAGEK